MTVACLRLTARETREVPAHGRKGHHYHWGHGSRQTGGLSRSPLQMKAATGSRPFGHSTVTRRAVTAQPCRTSVPATDSRCGAARPGHSRRTDSPNRVTALPQWGGGQSVPRSTARVTVSRKSAQNETATPAVPSDHEAGPPLPDSDPQRFGVLPRSRRPGRPDFRPAFAGGCAGLAARLTAAVKCRRPSRCPECCTDMRRGQRIRLVDGRWMHDGCGPDD